MTLGQGEIQGAALEYATAGQIDRSIADEIADLGLDIREAAVSAFDASQHELEQPEVERLNWFIRQLGKDPINRTVFIETSSAKHLAASRSTIPPGGRHSSPFRKPEYS